MSKIPCFLCKKKEKVKLIENFTDPLENNSYKLYKCSDCDFIFSIPMRAPSPRYYKEFTKLFGTTSHKSPIPNWRLKYLKNLSPNKKILDIGCGYGSFLVKAKTMGFNVSGMDFDNLKVHIAQKKGLENISVSNFKEFYKKNHDKKYDIITCFHILEHLENPKEFVQMINNLLLPGGLFFIELPNKNRKLKESSGIMDYPPHHLTRWSANSLKILLSNENFKVVFNNTPSPIIAFYDNLFSVFTIKISQFIKKLYFKSNSADTIEHLSTLTNKKFAPQSLRTFAVQTIKILYYLLFIPISFIFILPYVSYISKTNRGLFLFSLSKKNLN